MKPWARWGYGLAGLVAAFVAVSSTVAAISAGSWGPLVSVGWLPAVVAASWPGAGRRCLRGLSGPVG